ncbi:MAG TPA: MgtC/SapB family protein [Candidatus Acidoferrum sp.]|nr:MgtC/SapB family protein [Candidatus Acidoferrum sp.]
MSRGPRTSPAAVPAEAEQLPLTGGFADFALRLLVALVLGLVLGIEREFRGHPAGIKTMGLIALGACMFTTLGLIPEFGTRVDPTRIAAQIVTGVGFLGAGSILRLGGDVHGLTTAASIWVAASLGMAVGYGYYAVAVFTAFLVIVMLVAIRPLEQRFFRNRNRRFTDPPAPDPEV